MLKQAHEVPRDTGGIDSKTPKHVSKEYIFYTFVWGGANFVEISGVGVAPAH